MGSIPINVNGEYKKYELDPERPEVSLMRGEVVDSKVTLINTGNKTLSGRLSVNQFDCAHHCPLIEILSSTKVEVPVNESITIEYRITSKWFNDVQKLTFNIDVKTWEGDSFSIDIIVNVKHNLLHYSICMGLSIIVTIGLVLIIMKLKRGKK